MSRTHRIVVFGKWATQVCALLVVVIGSLTIIGWITHVRILTSYNPAYIPMAPNTALFFVVLGLCAFLLWFESRITHSIIRFLSIAVVAGALLRLIEFAFGLDLRVDRWVFKVPEAYLDLMPTGRMAFFTAVNFVFAGSSALLLSWPGNRRNLKNVAGVNTIVVACLGSAFCVAYFVGAPLLYSETVIPMALNTALAFFLLGISLFGTVTIQDFAEQHALGQEPHVSLEKKILAGFGFALSAILIVSIIAYNNIARSLDSARLEAHTHEVFTEVTGVSSAVKDAETVLREYLITNDTSLLEEYRSAVSQISRRLQGLRTLTEDNPDHQRLITALDTLMLHQAEFSNEIAQVLETRGPEAAQAMIRNRFATPPVQRSHDVAAEIEKQEHVLLVKLAREMEQSSRDTVLAFALLAVLVICMLGGIYAVVHRDLVGRKRAEHALRDASEKVHDLYNNAPCGYHSLNGVGLFVAMNDTELSWLGYSRDEVVGKMRFTDTTTDAGTRVFHEKFPILKEQGAVKDVEVEMKRRDGSTFFASISATAVRNAEGEFVHSRSTLFDITERKKAEIALRQLNEYLEERVQKRTASLHRSEERYRHLFEYNPLPMWVYDANTLAFIEVNNAAIRQYGYSRDEFLNMTIKDIRPTEEVGRLLEDVARHHKGLDIAGTWKHKKKDGTIIDVEITSHDIVYSGKEAKLVLANDVTERTRAEERFRLVVEASPNGIVMVDRQGRISLINSQTEKMFGYNRSELLGKSIELLVPEHLRRQHRHDRSKFLSDPQARPMGVGRDLYGLRKDGTGFPVEIGLIPIDTSDGIMVLGSIVDITTRKHAEEELRKSESRYRTTLDHMMEGCQIIGYDFRYLYVNQVAAAQGKSTQEELLGRTMMEMYPGIDNTPFFKSLKRCMEKRVPQRLENEFTFPDGSKGWFNLSLEPVPEGVFILSEDITKEKQMNEELRRYREHLEELVKERTEQLEIANKELEAFSYSVSHDLRSPLRHIDGFSELLQKNAATSLDEKGRHYLTIISQSVKRMGVLIDELLVFSRMGRTEMRNSNVEIDVLIKEALLELQNEINGRDISWVVGRFPTVVGDPSMLRLVLVNLISNAIKYTRTRLQSRIEIGHKLDPNEHVFFIRDNGVGFDPQYTHKLFGVFQRLHADTEFEGTGIGLANVRRIVARHGGRTWAEAKVNEGATFYFSLPLDRMANRNS